MNNQSMEWAVQQGPIHCTHLLHAHETAVGRQCPTRPVQRQQTYAAICSFNVSTRSHIEICHTFVQTFHALPLVQYFTPAYSKELDGSVESYCFIYSCGPISVTSKPCPPSTLTHRPLREMKAKATAARWFLHRGGKQTKLPERSKVASQVERTENKLGVRPITRQLDP